MLLRAGSSARCSVSVSSSSSADPATKEVAEDIGASMTLRTPRSMCICMIATYDSAQSSWYILAILLQAVCFALGMGVCVLVLLTHLQPNACVCSSCCLSSPQIGHNFSSFACDIHC